jgi:glycosyltransferase involved in cell wall biosynthesis
MAFVKDVRVLASNFDHIRKESIQVAGGGVTRLPVRAYPRNISFSRVLSYWDFARQVGRSPVLAASDMAYVCVPDYLSALAVLRRRTGACPRVIIDVVDIWPEALPLPGLVEELVRRTLWQGGRSLRQRLFAKADLVLFQSRYFLDNYGRNSERNRFLPMCLKQESQLRYPVDRPSLSKEIKVVFLGSMNAITDIASLAQILCLLAAKRKVRLSVVGGGSGLEYLKQQLRGTAVLATFHGITFDVEFIMRELTQAHFGYNGYKESTEVAVSYKSLEYLQHGLPMINSAKGDTFEIVRDDKCGVNFHRQDLPAAVGEILSVTDQAHGRMCQNARKAFEENFSYQRFRRMLEEYMGVAMRAASAHE